MEHQEGYFKGVHEADIFYQYWLPEEKPRGCLVIVHGLAEHCGRYMNVVNTFVPKGFAVYGLDHFGHGNSEGERVFVQRFEDFTIPLKKYFDMIDIWQPGVPVFLVGHSLGGLIGSYYLLDHQDELDGAVFSGPGVKIPENISVGTIVLGKIFSFLMPKFGILQLDANAVSKDPAVVEAYVNDPLVFTGKSTARLGAEMLKAMQRVTDQMDQINLPILILQGSEDKLVDPDGAKKFYENISSKDKTLKIYEGLYHEVFNEPERDQVLTDMEVWLEAHCINNSR